MKPERWQQIEQLCHAALEREENQRAPFLEEACRGDESLRREVEFLLEQETEAKDFLEAPALEVAAQAHAERQVLSMLGKEIGTYKILSLLGSGGMGEVYLAEDRTLDRKVALKFLPEEMRRDETARKRFLREAKSAAALDHAFICHIHEVGEAEGKSFISMEYVQGETLKDQLGKGPLSLQDALANATEIAEALEAAHRQNIIHRDLKPSNIMIIPDGHVKVLDFGLAKRLTPVDGEDSREKTLTASLTATGATLGTVPYMSPEQVRGQVVDTRSDIFSFGVVLYEMLTGVNPFKGDTSVDTSHAILVETPPPLSRYTENIPVLLQHTVKKMLAKEPDRRYQLIHEVRTDLGELVSGDAQIEIKEAISEPVKMPAREVDGTIRWRWAISGGLFLCALGALVAGLLVWNLKVLSPVSTVARLTVTLPPGEFLSQSLPDFDVSSDGTHFAYASNGQLYLRAIGDPEPVVLSSTALASRPFFSPDGEWIGFFAEGRLRKVAAVGGVPETLWDAGSGMGGSWAPDDTIYFAPFNTSGIWKVSASGGGVAQPVTELDREAGEISHRWPQVLPGGEAVLFTVWTGPGFAERRVELHVLETGERRVVASGGDTGRYVPSGHVVYSIQSDQVFMAVPFNLENLRATGSAVALDDAVAVGIEGALYAVSESGVLVHITADPARYRTRLAWVHRDGSLEPIGPEGLHFNPRLSPDGQFAVVDTLGPKWGISIYDFSRELFSVIPGDESSQCPLWHPNGEDIVYRGTRRGFRNVYRRLLTEAVARSNSRHRTTF